MEKKTVFSGIQPTGKLHIGNYLGAIIHWKKMQEDFNCIFCAVDMHSITVKQEPESLRNNTLDLLALYIACGLEPKKSILFAQSHVAAHAEFAWVLNTLTYVGELSRMTQFKDKSKKNPDNINMGLMDYPVLMASDILLYNAHAVPVGQDQKQHLELARNVGERFNARYGKTFVIPDAYINKTGAKIFSLTNPTAKMSKSDDNENSNIYLTDTPDEIVSKLKRAVTDSGSDIRFAAEKPGISNLLAIYSLLNGKNIKESEEHFDGKGYGVFKKEVADAIIEALRPIQAEKARIRQDLSFIMQTLENGAERAENIANKTLKSVYEKIGFIPRPR